MSTSLQFQFTSQKQIQLQSPHILYAPPLDREMNPFPNDNDGGVDNSNANDGIPMPNEVAPSNQDATTNPIHPAAAGMPAAPPMPNMMPSMNNPLMQLQWMQQMQFPWGMPMMAMVNILCVLHILEYYGCSLHVSAVCCRCSPSCAPRRYAHLS